MDFAAKTADDQLSGVLEHVRQAGSGAMDRFEQGRGLGHPSAVNAEARHRCLAAKPGRKDFVVQFPRGHHQQAEMIA